MPQSYPENGACGLLCPLKGCKPHISTEGAKRSWRAQSVHPVSPRWWARTNLGWDPAGEGWMAIILVGFQVEGEEVDQGRNMAWAPLPGGSSGKGSRHWAVEEGTIPGQWKKCNTRRRLGRLQGKTVSLGNGLWKTGRSESELLTKSDSVPLGLHMYIAKESCLHKTVAP